MTNPPNSTAPSPGEKALNVHLVVDPLTAIKIGEYFERDKRWQHADAMWRVVSDRVAYSRPLREHYSQVMFEGRIASFPPRSLERLRYLLNVMAFGFPTQRLAAAYFEDLERILAERPKLSQPGTVVLGVGSGRCGSSTLSAGFAALPDACATHENPPHVYWQPLPEQVEFHFRRLHLLTEYFPLVFDAAHWWLNLQERFFAEFPTGRMIGLARDTETCAFSYLKFQGRGRGSYNYWAAPDIDFWTPGLWAPTYPSFSVPESALANDESALAAKKAMIATYVDNYNRRLARLAEAEPGRFVLIRTEAMNEPESARQISELVGRPIAMPTVSLNVGNNLEGSQPEFWH